MQCRAARALLNISQSQIAKSAHIVTATVSEYERGSGTPVYNNLLAIQTALETAGVVFVPENGGGLGVRLHGPRTKRAPAESNFSSDLCRAARGLLGLSQMELGEAANLSRSTVTEFERGARMPDPENLAALRTALETAGVAFMPADRSGGPGVRLHDRSG